MPNCRLRLCQMDEPIDWGLTVFGVTQITPGHDSNTVSQTTHAQRPASVVYLPGNGSVGVPQSSVMRTSPGHDNSRRAAPTTRARWPSSVVCLTAQA